MKNIGGAKPDDVLASYPGLLMHKKGLPHGVLLNLRVGGNCCVISSDFH